MAETEMTIKDLKEKLDDLIKQGHGDKEFQIYYDGETVYTTIPKGSAIRINDDGVRFTDEL